ncbi:MAG: 2-hydroxyacyl-CoA dehydratase family protein, partial [Bacillota bacterium]
RTINEDKLRLEIKRKNRLLAKVRKILELRIRNPFYIRSLPTILLLNIGLNNYFGKPEEFEAAVDMLIEELATRPADAQDLKRVIPLVWGYGTGQEFGVFEAIDQAGGALLGLRGVPFKDYREDVPPLESLVRYIYDNQSAGAGIYARNVIEQEIDKINARGLLLYGYIGCSFSSVDKEMWREYFHQKGIPSISLEGSFQVGEPTGQVLTRVKAFIEMLA